MNMGVVLRAAVAAVGLVALGSLAWQLTSEPVPTSYGALGGHLTQADIAAIVALALVGAAALIDRARVAVGVLLLTTALVWASADLGSVLPTWDVAGFLAIGLPLLLAPLLLHLATEAPDGRGGVGNVGPETAARTWRRRGLLSAAYAVAVLPALVWLAAYDPFLDLACWRTCHHGPGLLVLPQSTVSQLRHLADLATVGVCVAGVVVAVGRLRGIPSYLRIRRTIGLTPIGLVCVATAAVAVARLTVVERSTSDLYQALFVLQALTLVLVALGALPPVLGREARVRRSLARLTRELQTFPSSEPLDEVLRRVLDDPEVVVLYPTSHGLVARDGTRAALPDGRATVAIAREGRTLALVAHSLGWSPARVRDIGAAAQVAVDNERMRASLLSQVEELRESQARIVETGDAARHQLERDLHDGAQQQGLSLLLRLRMARDAAAGRGEEGVAARLADACREAELALAELRDLAHGIYPAILAESGLSPALHTLADTAPCPVRLEEAPPERLAADVERAAYAVVAGTVEASTGALAVRVRRGSGSLLVTIVGDSLATPTDVLETLAARVGALRGHLDVGPGRLEAMIPCA